MCGRASVLEERAVLVAPGLVGAAADGKAVALLRDCVPPIRLI